MGEAFDSLPDWLKNKIRYEFEIEALMWMMGKDIRQGKATDAEICATICLASVQAPLDHDAAQIYLYVGTALMQERGYEVPADIRTTELTQDQARKLNDWRYQLYRKRGKAETQITKSMKEVFGTRRKKSTPVEEQEEEGQATLDMHIQEATAGTAGIAGFVEGVGS